jgi:hypothetical protein
MGCVVNSDDDGGADGSDDTAGTSNGPTTTNTTPGTTTNDTTVGGTADGSGTTDPTMGDSSGTTAVDPGPFVGDDPDPTLYTRVDFQGMPAVNTALIPCEDPDMGDCLKDDYNNATQAQVSGPMFDQAVSDTIFGLVAALDDDVTAAGLTTCDPPDCVSFVDDLIEPDALSIDTDVASGFNNGRLLEDPVIDITLAAILLGDATQLGAFAALPLNPAANDVAFEKAFPYLAAPN